MSSQIFLNPFNHTNLVYFVGNKNCGPQPSLDSTNDLNKVIIDVDSLELNVL